MKNNELYFFTATILNWKKLLKPDSFLMFDVAEVPISLRNEYYVRWNLKRQTLTPK
jgi:hypothetical protein